MSTSRKPVARAYRVRVHRGLIAPSTITQMEAAGLTPRQLPEQDEVVEVNASRDGLAMTHASLASWEAFKASGGFAGQTVTYFEILADGSERELVHGC